MHTCACTLVCMLVYRCGLCTGVASIIFISGCLCRIWDIEVRVSAAHRTIKIWDLKAALDPRTPAAELCLRTLAISCTLSTCVCVCVCVCVYTKREPSITVYCSVCGAVIPPYTLSAWLIHQTHLSSIFFQIDKNCGGLMRITVLTSYLLAYYSTKIVSTTM